MKLVKPKTQVYSTKHLRKWLKVSDNRASGEMSRRLCTLMHIHGDIDSVCRSVVYDMGMTTIDMKKLLADVRISGWFRLLFDQHLCIPQHYGETAYIFYSLNGGPFAKFGDLTPVKPTVVPSYIYVDEKDTIATYISEIALQVISTLDDQKLIKAITDTYSLRLYHEHGVYNMSVGGKNVVMTPNEIAPVYDRLGYVSNHDNHIPFAELTSRRYFDADLGDIVVKLTKLGFDDQTADSLVIGDNFPRTKKAKVTKVKKLKQTAPTVPPEAYGNEKISMVSKSGAKYNVTGQFLVKFNNKVYSLSNRQDKDAIQAIIDRSKGLPADLVEHLINLHIKN